MTGHSGTTATRLSARQRQVVALIAAGHTNRQIAGLLHITLHTVKAHVEAAMEKLDAANRGHAALIALQRGEI
jgi:two-component system NarL family response regulator